MTLDMLKEMQVIDAVCSFLEANHFRIVDRVRSVYERGIDIVAESPGTKTKLAIEAKGQTTSKKTSRRGKEFTSNQKEDHLGRALVKSCQAISLGQVAAIALPEDPVDLSLIDSIRRPLLKLGVLVFMVQSTGTVRLELGALPR